MNRKNVLMICTDHWPAALMGCAGRRDIMTPTLDELARGGVLFDRFYSECPVCIPARRSIMTGLTPRTHGDRVYSDRMTMPDVTTLARAFGLQGYQTCAVGKLHVYPQRDRIGFDDVQLMEEGRYEFGVVDDYQTWLGENGYLGQEYTHGMGNNTYFTRTWHLDERAHPTTWVTMEMMRQIKRKDPTRPAFFYCSYCFPHPPLVPLKTFWDMYEDVELDAPLTHSWDDGRKVFEAFREPSRRYSEREIARARRAFMAQCTHIDYSIRMLIGTLREQGLLNDTIIVFTSDHGDMLFDHQFAGKRMFYDGSARVPLIISGAPMAERAGTVCHSLGQMTDIMPTLLELCGLNVPDTVEGRALLGDYPEREYIFGEISDDIKATRMIRDARYKLIYYPCGNITQLFDMESDPGETTDISGEPGMRAVLDRLSQALISELYGADREWIQDGRLRGFPEPERLNEHVNYGLYNQRGSHWPPPPRM